MKIGRYLSIAVAAFGFVLASAHAARAGSYLTCSVSDVQYVNMQDDSKKFVFKACGFFWGTGTTAPEFENVRSLVMAAFLSNKTVNVQCGAQPHVCTSAGAAVYENNVLLLRSVWNIDGIQIMP